MWTDTSAYNHCTSHVIYNMITESLWQSRGKSISGNLHFSVQWKEKTVDRRKTYDWNYRSWKLTSTWIDKRDPGLLKVFNAFISLQLMCRNSIVHDFSITFLWMVKQLLNLFRYIFVKLKKFQILEFYSSQCSHFYFNSYNNMAVWILQAYQGRSDKYLIFRIFDLCQGTLTLFICSNT